MARAEQAIALVDNNEVDLGETPIRTPRREQKDPKAAAREQIVRIEDR